MKIKFHILPLVFLFLLSQNTFADEDQRRIEERKRDVLSRSEPAISKAYERISFEYGGWINYRYMNLQDTDNDDSTLDSLDDSNAFDSRLWLKTTFKPAIDSKNQNEHEFYLRLKDLYVQTDGDSSVERYDHDGPHLDYAYLTLNFDHLKVELGRKYFNIGQGIAYSNVNDGVQINYLTPGWNIGGFFSHTLPFEDNIDLSVPGGTKSSDRYYYGLGVGYARIKDHQFYGYVMGQSDFSDEKPNNTSQQFTYNSQYYGLGAKGKSYLNIEYWIEVIKQTGTSYVFGSNEKSDVDAWAVDLGIEKGFNSYGNPSFSFEYAYGSGDSDRTSVTDTEFGNTAGNDNNFLYFGYLPTGYALSPRLSNLHLFHLESEINLLNKIKTLENVRFKLGYFWFLKDKSQGGISDLQATEGSKDIGSEIDITIEWPLFSDLDITVEYGHFMPGKAYASTANDAEDYFAISIAHSF